MMIRIYKLVAIIFVICSSCNNNNRSQIELLSHETINSISDSIFFKSVGQIELNNNNLYILDGSHVRIVKCDKNLNFVKFIGRHGLGPGELRHPDSFTFDRYGILYIKDSGTILKYKDDKFIESQKLFNNRINSKFAFCDSKIYVSAPDSFNTIMVLDSLLKIRTKFGNPNKYKGSPIQVMKKNEKNIFISEKENILSISSFDPLIQLYSKSGLLLDEIEIDNPIVKSRLEYSIKTQRNPMSAVSFFRDIYYDDSSLYLLAYDHLHKDIKVSCNKVLKYDIINSKIVFDQIFELKPSTINDGYYSAICVIPDNKIIAFEIYSGTFQIFKQD
jgi:hypothetical protein